MYDNLCSTDLNFPGQHSDTAVLLILAIENSRRTGAYKPGGELGETTTSALGQSMIGGTC